ncbi:MAG: TetR/AcrR family transcriptional regulator [Clostridia bacterium]|nr:TetR/AcrR family transcriptional regulator [Clostridia bacterium]MBR1703776.1 TetR/AcrR family transcriptional regulator [Clostridia bacterium]
MENERRYERNVVEDLLEAAKRHFLENGYDKASLRKICASAGVTTGALYFSFKSKEDLFDALVNPTLTKLDEVLGYLDEQVFQLNGKRFDEKKFNDFIFQFLIDNREGLRLLMARAGGSQYESFAGKIHGVVEKLMAHYARTVGEVEIDPQLVSILTNMYFAAVSDLIARDYDHGEMTRVAGALRACMEQGFYAMLEQQRAEG